MENFKIRNRSFDRIGDQYTPVIDKDHFLGHTPFGSHWKKGTPGEISLTTTGELFVMEVSAQGYAKEELTVAISDDILVVRGLKKSKKEHPETAMIVEEFDTESFERKFKISSNISRERITAKYESGILRLTFIDVPPEEEKNARLIEVV